MSYDVTYSVRPHGVETTSQYLDWLNSEEERGAVATIEDCHPNVKSFFYECVRIVPPFDIDPGVNGLSLDLEGPIVGAYSLTRNSIIITIKSLNSDDQTFEETFQKLSQLSQDFDIVEQCDGQVINNRYFFDDYDEWLKRKKAEEKNRFRIFEDEFPMLTLKLVRFIQQHGELPSLRNLRYIPAINNGEFCVRIFMVVADADFPKFYSLFNRMVKDFYTAIKSENDIRMLLQVEKTSAFKKNFGFVATMKKFWKSMLISKQGS